MQVILTDGDMSSLENMQRNLELNHLTSELGADIIYDPKCAPHLVQVLRTLLTSNRSRASRSTEQTEASIAYIASVIRNKDTFQYFLLLAEEARLSVLDITDDFQPLNLLPYMLSYDRTSVRLLQISYSFS
ncbi:hypothetical protein KSP39_PZI001621 [Platanthera zijinensis]|uniref:Uncharacterized protein n=1 Tax=Platanthera zijinensis TaxID=2320716 RepID=A0AAP0BYV7_9ASPA